MTAVRGRQGYKADWAHHVISLSFGSLQFLLIRIRVSAFASRQSLSNPRHTLRWPCLVIKKNHVSGEEWGPEDHSNLDDSFVAC